MEGPPGTHLLTPVCGNGAEHLSLVALNFYYCAFTVDTLVNSAVAVAIAMVIVFYIANRISHRVPGKLQMVLEFVLSYAKDLTHETVAEDADFIIPIASTIGIYILIANWLDFLPITGFGLHPANADLNQTMAMAIVVILVVQWYSLRVLGLRGYLRRFTKPFDMALPVRILFIPLNVIEEVVKPVTLALRLFGNIFAGLLMAYLIGLLFSAGITGGGLTKVFAPLGVVFLFAWKAFDVFFVGTIQAFIFMLLTVIYFGMAREGIEEEAHGRHSPSPGRPEAVPASPH